MEFSFFIFLSYKNGIIIQHIKNVFMWKKELDKEIGGDTCHFISSFFSEKKEIFKWYFKKPILSLIHYFCKYSESDSFKGAFLSKWPGS